MTRAILAYAGHLPQWRVDPGDRPAPRRIVASFDEDAITMAVAAAGRILADREHSVDSLVFVSGTPPYADKTNATIVHAALGLDRRVRASDALGTGRTTMAAIASACTGPNTLITAADVRVGRPGSADERAGADAAAALLVGAASTHCPALAHVLGAVALTEEFLDRWREPTAAYGTSWEERFGYERYAPLITEAARLVLDEAGLPEADHVVLTSPNPAVGKRVSTLVKGAMTTCGPPVGFAGAVDPLLGLVHALDTAGPDETILLISAVDGVDALLVRTTTALAAHRSAPLLPVPAGRPVPYRTYLSWRGLLDVEPPRRPDPDRPAAPPAARAADWKFALRASACTTCGFVHAPPMRVCRACGAVDEMRPVPLAQRHGRVATYTVDRLAYSPSPPVVDVVVDFDGGGRATFEVAEAAADTLAVGAPVAMTFRRLFTAQGVHNYFWKAHQIVQEDLA